MLLFLAVSEKNKYLHFFMDDEWSILFDFCKGKFETKTGQYEELKSNNKLVFKIPLITPIMKEDKYCEFEINRKKLIATNN